MSKRRVKSEIFRILSNMVNDDSMKDLYAKMSIGKFPPSFEYKDGFLSYEKNKVREFILIDDSNIEKLAVDLTAFIIDYFDEKKETERIENEKNERTSVLSLKRKNARESLIANFSLDFVIGINEINNVYHESLKLFFFIKDSLYNKLLDLSDIVLANNKIASINGLLYDKESKKFIIQDYPGKKKRKSFKASSKKIEDIFFNAWMKKIKTMKRKRESSSIVDTYSTTIKTDESEMEDFY